jgi:hypothetical protein
MTVSLHRQETQGDRLVYTFGSSDETAGRVAVDPASGDVEVLDLNDDMPPPGAPFYLSAVVERLQAFHDDGSFPETDAWKA